MSLGFVFLQNAFYLQKQRSVPLFQTLGQILVYGAFADAKLLGSRADSRLILYNVCCEIVCALFNVAFQKNTTPGNRFQ